MVKREEEAEEKDDEAVVLLFILTLESVRPTHISRHLFA